VQQVSDTHSCCCPGGSVPRVLSSIQHDRVGLYERL
jgi:hypothetical protein